MYVEATLCTRLTVRAHKMIIGYRISIELDMKLKTCVQCISITGVAKMNIMDNLQSKVASYGHHENVGQVNNTPL